jgi:hypothetical protein
MNTVNGLLFHLQNQSVQSGPLKFLSPLRYFSLELYTIDIPSYYHATIHILV